MKNIDIVTIVNAYQKSTGDLALPASIMWKRRLNLVKLSQAKQIIDEALREIDNRYMDDEHSLLTEKGDGRMVKPEYLAEFIRAKDEILSQDTDVDVKKILIDDLGNITLTDAQMDTLAFMIDDD